MCLFATPRIFLESLVESSFGKDGEGTMFGLDMFLKNITDIDTSNTKF